jgi:hypothetical protein
MKTMKKSISTALIVSAVFRGRTGVSLGEIIRGGIPALADNLPMRTVSYWHFGGGD